MGLIKALRDTEPFNNLPEESIAELNQAAVLKRYPPQTNIFNQHDPPTGFLYLIKEGLVEIVILTPGGVEMVVDYRQEGSFFGGTPIFTNEPYTAGARTARATECYLIPQELLTRIAKRYPHITEHFTRAVLSRVRSLYSEMVGDHHQRSLTQMEAFPFKKRLSEIMSAPLESCSSLLPAEEVARRMTDRGIGALIVQDDTLDQPGIITKHDLVSKVLASGKTAGLLSAADIMTPNPFTMTPDAYMYEAAAFMLGHKIKHLPIRDHGELVGMVTLRDLMRFRSQKSMLLVGQVKEARTIEALVEARQQTINVAKALLGETRSHFETMEILSHIHHSIMRRCFELLLEDLQAQGITPPDIRFCLMIMGSGGRKEMLLGPDQDNGLIYEDFPDSRLAEVEAFFIPFTAQLVKTFARIGYPLCNGKVMADNPLWRGRLKDWQARVGNWIHAPEPKRVMYTTIFLDFMPLMGDATLCQQLRIFLHQEVRRNPIFLH
jgi:CBS domain-containing protein